MLLMYAALRWIEERGGNRIVAIGRLEFLDLYLRLGFRDCVVGLLAIEGPNREEETHSRPNLA